MIVEVCETGPGRRYSVTLWAEAPDAGPYHLGSYAGHLYASWVEPARHMVPVTQDRPLLPHGLSGTPYAVVATWVPIYRRARLALALCDLHHDVEPHEAKAAADWCAARGVDGAGLGAVSLAHARVTEMRERAAKRGRL